jgi:hypothetical protein
MLCTLSSPPYVLQPTHPSSPAFMSFVKISVKVNKKMKERKVSKWHHYSNYRSRGACIIEIVGKLL